jgi:DNA-binding response OmpR family regulator
MRTGPVLVVEHNEFTLRLIAYRLAAGGFDVRTARTIDEALEGLRLHRPRLVLLDAEMPDLDRVSIALLKTKCGTAKLVAMIPMDSANARDLLSAVGIDEFVPKVLDPETLPAVVARRLASE